MRKLLKTQDILLLGLSGILDLFEEIRDPLKVVSSSYKAMYGWVPEQYKRNNFNHLVWRNIKTGFIEKIEKKGEIYIRLTSQGAKRVVRDFPLLSLQRKKWDKKWRVVIFDIAEINKNIRDNLRKKLKELGFGMVQKSVFISPHDIIEDFFEFIKNSGLSEVVYIFETSNLTTGDLKKFASKIWSLEKLNEKYREIIIKAEEQALTNTRDRVKALNALDTKNREKLIRELRKEFVEILAQDPFLPKELLPLDWQGEKARIIVRGLGR